MVDLDEIYRQVPEVQCLGLCVEACSFIPLARQELVQLRAQAGRRVRAVGPKTPDGILHLKPDGLSCPVLKNGRCSVYRARPLICRLYGAAEGLECPHGCRPTGRLLTTREASDLLRQVYGR